MIKPHKNIIIICEGLETETSYLNEYRDLIIDKGINVNIDIKPKPKKQLAAEVFILRDGAKKRQLRGTAQPPLDTVEPEYRAQPTRYVREAQMNLENGTYDEAWAVFDKDGHPNHSEAFLLAQKVVENKVVNIAFSSIAFEYWILLHFEENPTAFEKSLCRVAKTTFNCGLDSHENDCKGIKCVCGRIVNQGFLEYSSKGKDFRFSDYNPFVLEAIARALRLRAKYHDLKEPIFNLNPYTTVDKLVFKLINLPIDFIWTNLYDSTQIDHLQVKVENKEGNLTFYIFNISNSRQILNPDTLVLINLDGNIIPCGVRKVVDDLSQDPLIITIDMSDYSNQQPKYVGVKNLRGEYLISEIME